MTRERPPDLRPNLGPCDHPPLFGEGGPHNGPWSDYPPANFDAPAVHDIGQQTGLRH